jgi:hypothetical protein
MARAAFALALLAAMAAPSRIEASEPFPAVIRAELGLEAAPGCDLCHEAAATPVGAADQPFSRSAEARGLVAGDDSSLVSALAAMESDGVDSDGDGARDLDELWWGGDPNHADLPVGGPREPPSYGCAARPGAHEGGGLLVVSLALLVASRRTRGAPRAKV